MARAANSPTKKRTSKVAGKRQPAEDITPEITDQVVSVKVTDLRPSPENDLLYRERHSGKPDRKRLVKSIREIGVQAPLLVSRDRFIISGHERFAASIEAELDVVPVIILSLRRSDYTADEWLAVLREHNTGRTKTLDERIREEMVDAAVVETAGQVVDELVAQSDITSKTIQCPDEVKTRARISAQTRGFADAIKWILNEGDLKGLIVNERAIHYRLLTMNVSTSTRSDGFVYGAPDKDSVGALSRMLTRLRLNGEVPWSRIIDETRPAQQWITHANAADFVAEQVRELFTGYARDLLQSQDAYYVIVAEKLTVQSFVNRVAARYTMPTVIIRGSSGIDARYQIAKRFKESCKRRMVLFVLTDCDPAGDMIAETTVHSLRDEFDIGNNKLEAIRVAFTHDQADKYGLSATPGLVCKESSVTPKFIKLHGRNDCYELEAVSPQTLQSILDESIRANINVDRYNAEVTEQDADNAEIVVRRKVVRAELGKANSEYAADFDETDGDE